MTNLFSGLMKILNKEQKTKMAILQVLFLVSAVVQVGGIASIAPFIAVISNPSVIDTNPVLSFLYDYFKSTSLTEFLIIYALLVAAFILVSNTVSALVLWLLFHFAVNTGAELQQRLYSKYMANSYVYFANNNSSELIANITAQIPRFVYMVIQPSLLLISQAFVALIIVSGLFYLDPVLALTSSILVLSIYLAIYMLLRKKMEEAGETLTEVAKRKLILLSESIIGIREVKLLDIEEWYKEELNKTTLSGLNAQAFSGLAGDLPKFVVETIVFISILGLAIYLITTQGENGSAMSTLSLYALAGYKLLPAAQTVYKGLSSLKANGSVINEIEKQLRNAERDIPPESDNSRSAHIELKNNRSFGISLKKVTYSYPNSDINVISGIDMNISENTLNSLVGGSGAGKSTIANLILGLLEPSEGVITVGGEVITSQNLKSWQSNIGYVPQSIFLIDDSFERNIAFGIPADRINSDRVKLAAKRANIHEFIVEQEQGYGTPVGENGGRLSGGQRQRIGIARALYKNPSILVLDEATSALDTITEALILKEISYLSSSMTVIMIAHRLSTIVNSDQIFVFKAGTIEASGSYSNLLEKSTYFKDLVDRNKLEEPEVV